MKKSVAYRRKFECKLKRKKIKCRSIYKFSALDFVATEAKKMVAEGKNVRHLWNFVGAWNLMSRAEQPCRGKYCVFWFFFVSKALSNYYC